MTAPRLALRLPIFSVLLAVVISLCIPATSAFAANGGGGGSGDTAYGFSADTAGNHNGATGSGTDTSGYAAVRFTGAVPKKTPTGEYISGCHPTANDKEFMDSDGYSKETINSTVWDNFYVHYRTYVNRTTGVNVGGAPDTTFWDQAWSAATGNAVAGAVPDGKAPSKANPTVGAHWFNAKMYCLPLKGGATIDNYLTAKAPAVTLQPATRAVVGMKKGSITIAGTNLCNTNSVGVWICMEYNGSLISYTYTKKKGAPQEFSILSASGPIKMSPIDIDPDINVGKYKLKFKKKGVFNLTIYSDFTATVLIIPTGQIVTVTGLRTTAVIPPLNVIDVRSVNRKT